ncbi:MAG: hypothetical protein LWW75_02255, partial [Chlorobiales bacterium]|nr:hypothetical protein [Chlorobiales bacterium]
LTLIYIAYVGMISENLKDSYFWAKPFIVASNWLAMWSSFSNLFFGEILTKGVLFVIAVSVFTNFIADRRLREINILK